MNKVAEYYDQQAADYHKQYDGTSEDYPANAIRLKHIISRLKTLKAKSVLEIGVGEGTPLLEIAKLGFEVTGCDISKKMVEQAWTLFKSSGLSPHCIWHGDSELFKDERFDSIIAAGVLPHADDDKLISDIHRLLNPGGSAIVEFRNSLFSLFTFNRNTLEFILHDLLAGVSEDCKNEVRQELLRRLLLPKTPDTEFDLISRFHNPFVLQDTFAKHGFQTTGFIWYHAHPAMPHLEERLGAEFRKEAMKLEKGDDWRGMFMCSAGLIEVKK